MTTAQHEKLIRMLVGENCSREWVLRQQPEPGAKAGELIPYGEDHLTCAIECLMVGMEPEALELLVRSDGWMAAALDRAAAGEAVELEFLRHFRQSLCRWLLGPPAPPHDLTRGCQLLAASQEMALADLGEYADYLDSTLAELVYAERYAECVAKYEHEQAKDIRSTDQRHADAMRDYEAGLIAADEAAALHQEHVEAPMAYLVARERLKSTLSERALADRFERFLRERVPIWLKYARYDLFAMWVQITTRAEAGAAARAAIHVVADRYA
jgi:hypothetical protein